LVVPAEASLISKTSSRMQKSLVVPAVEEKSRAYVLVGINLCKLFMLDATSIGEGTKVLKDEDRMKALEQSAIYLTVHGKEIS